jgi:acetyl-CoA C-acetyltransferase
MRESDARRRGVAPVARIAGHAVHAQAPEWFTTPRPAPSTSSEEDRLAAGEVDLWEINEAFAAVAMAAMAEHGLPHAKVNVHGGACALGHPIGASGARIVVTLLGALRRRGSEARRRRAVHRRRRGHGPGRGACLSLRPGRPVALSPARHGRPTPEEDS